MSECDCPDGYIKCGWMNYCIQENLIEDMCPFSLPVNCKKYSGFIKKGKDDICRSRCNILVNNKKTNST